MAGADQILWKGKVSIRGILSFVSTRYAEVTKDQITFKRNENSEPMFYIKLSEIESMVLPQYGAVEVVLTGFRGFIIKYRQDGKNKKIMFWPKGFASYPNEEETGKLIKILGSLVGKTDKEMDQSKKSSQATNYFWMLGAIILGWFVGGVFGALVMIVPGYICLKFSQKDDVSPTVKYTVIIGSIVLGAILSFVVSLLVLYIVGG